MEKDQQVTEYQNPEGELHPVSSALPVATISILVISAILTSLQLLYPMLLPALDRNVGALRAGQWWRLVTPRFVNPEIWTQYVLLVILALVGPAVERRHGGLRWLMLWLAAGIVGEVVSFAWQPQGAGASLGICGLMGAWLMLMVRGENTKYWVPSVVSLALTGNLVGMALGNWLLGGGVAVVVASLLIQMHRHDVRWGRLTPVLGMVGLLGGLILTVMHDQHGPPLLVGAGIAAVYMLIEK